MLADGYKKKGLNFFIYDTVRGEWRHGGTIRLDVKGRLFESYHTTLMHKWQSLGVSLPILKELDRMMIKRIFFKFGKKSPYKYYLSYVENHLNSDLVVDAKNEKGETAHMRLVDMREI